MTTDDRVQRAADEEWARRPQSRLGRRDAEFWHAVLSIEGIPVKPLDDMVADFESGSKGAI